MENPLPSFLFETLGHLLEVGSTIPFVSEWKMRLPRNHLGFLVTYGCLLALDKSETSLFS